MPLNRRQVIPSGSFVIEPCQQLRLEAYLGTCVGVALFDRKNRVGGLLHILLPEPPGHGHPPHPEKYALTALPMGIEALRRRGAQTDTLKAVVAGGALIGPVNQTDLNLNIGGRTQQIITRLLSEAGIEILVSETGGMLGCKLWLDLEQLNYGIEPIVMPKTKTALEPFTWRSADMAKVIEQIQPIPQVALQVIQMMQSGDWNTQTVIDEIRQDQVICARVLKLCNAAGVNPAARIDSLELGVIYLGQQRLTRYILAAYVEDFWRHKLKGYSLCKGGLYHHAIGTALIAERLADSSATITPAQAYTAGLIHDIGKVVLDQYIAADETSFYRSLESASDFMDAETKILGVTHTQVGGQLAEKWGLPDSLIDVIRFHHYPEKAAIEPELTALVYLADFLMAKFQPGLELERINDGLLLDRLATLNLTPAALDRIIDKIPARVFRLAWEPNGTEVSA